MHQLNTLSTTKLIGECYEIMVTSQEESSNSYGLSKLASFDEKQELRLPEDMPEKLHILFRQYKNVFSIPMSLPPTRHCDHRIPLKADAQPVKVKPYRYPHSQKIEIEKMLSDMLQKGLIKVSNSPFSSPIILVKKKNGFWRFCTDYRALNAITIKDAFPILAVDELLDELYGAKIFSILDLRSSYHQVLLHPKDKHETAFRAHSGHFQWLVMAFGLSNSLATFQPLINSIFHFAMRKFVLIFINDILVIVLIGRTALNTLR